MSSCVVLDASVTVAWGNPEEHSLAADRVMDAIVIGGAIVPVIWTLEVANAVLVAERRGRLTNAVGVEFLTRLQQLPIHVDTVSGSLFSQAVFGLARDYCLSYYDATYLELAMRTGLPLATFDTALLRAMGMSGVATFTPTS